MRKKSGRNRKKPENLEETGKNETVRNWVVCLVRK